MDAGNSAAHAALFLRELAAYNLPQIDLLALTHHHWDHIFGMRQMNLPAVAHIETKRQMENMLDWKWTDEALAERVAQGAASQFCADNIKKELADARDIAISLPTIVFEEKLEIDLGGVTCLIEHVGGDHAPDSCVLYVKEEKVLFLGDCLGPATPNRYYTRQQVLPLLAQLKNYDADVVVPSHWRPLSRNEMQTELFEYRSLLESTWEHAGNKEAITHEIAAKWGRELNPSDLPFIDHFIAGYHLENNRNEAP
jgi:glyoxylase-like metal-dependent hydrolase (beta-lactamase superfamily II)